MFGFYYAYWHQAVIFRAKLMLFVLKNLSRLQRKLRIKTAAAIKRNKACQTNRKDKFDRKRLCLILSYKYNIPYQNRKIRKNQ